MATAPPIEIETGPGPDAAVILLHGLGADATDFEPIVSMLGIPRHIAIRFVLPNAPIRPITINMGMAMPAWYDIFEMGGRREDAAGIRASQQFLESLIAAQRSCGIAARRIFVAGFSQGGVIALQAGLRHAERLGGIVALSTYLGLADTLTAERAAANAEVPIFMAHGTHDDIIDIARAERSRATLEALDYRVDWHSYAMGHEVCPEEIDAWGQWLAERL